MPLSAPNVETTTSADMTRAAAGPEHGVGGVGGDARRRDHRVERQHVEVDDVQRHVAQP